jgi:hypothetical protein
MWNRGARRGWTIGVPTASLAESKDQVQIQDRQDWGWDRPFSGKAGTSSICLSNSAWPLEDQDFGSQHRGHVRESMTVKSRRGGKGRVKRGAQGSHV